jgi:hypothetical protein
MFNKQKHTNFTAAAAEFEIILTFEHCYVRNTVFYTTFRGLNIKELFSLSLSQHNRPCNPISYAK